MQRSKHNAVKHRALFVCLGNICRSPAADAIMHKLVEQRGVADDFHIDSAGTYGGHTGELPNPTMREAGTQRGYEMVHRSRQFVGGDFDRFDIIVVMDESNYRNVASIGGDASIGKVRRMTEFCRRHDISSVPDPYGEGRGKFEYVLDILEDGCEGLLEYLLASDK